MMSKTTSLSILLVACLLLVGGCASLAITERGQYSTTVGTATPNDIVQQAPNILRSRYNLEINRMEHDAQSNDVYIETLWEEQPPASDEQQEVTTRRTRYILEGRPRTRTGVQAGQVNVLQLTAQKEVLRRGESDWTRAEFTQTEQEFINELIDRLKAEIVTGVRTY